MGSHESNLTKLTQQSDWSKKSIYIFILIFNRNAPEYLACDVIALPENSGLNTESYAFQKNSPYMEIFNYFLQEMKEKGVTKQILEKYKSAPQVCPDMSGQPLGINNSFTAFLLLLGENLMFIYK